MLDSTVLQPKTATKPVEFGQPDPNIPVTPETPPVEFGGPLPQPSYPEKKAEDLAVQHQIAVGEDPGAPSYDEVMSSIKGGSFNLLQERMAAAKQLEQRKVRFDQVQELLQSGQKLTPDQQQFIMNLPEEKFKNPLSIMEEEFSKVVTQFLTTNHDAPITEDTHKILDFAENQMAKNLVVRNMHEANKLRYEQMNFRDNFNTYGSYVPFNSWYNLSKANPKADPYQIGIGQGQILGALVDYAKSQPDAASLATAYSETFQNLWENNPEDAMKFSEAMQSYTSDDQATDNLWSTIDVATTLTPAALLKGGKVLFRAGEKIAGKAAGVAEILAPKGAAKSVEAAGKPVQTFAEGEGPPGTPQLKKAAVAPPKVPENPLSFRLNGKIVKTTEASRNEIERVRVLLDHEIERLHKLPGHEGMRESQNETRNYLESWISEAEGLQKTPVAPPKPGEAPRAPVTKPLPPEAEAMKGATKVIAKDGAQPAKVLDGAGMSKEAGKVDAAVAAREADHYDELAESFGKEENIPAPIKADIQKWNLERLISQTMTLLNPGRFSSDIGTKSGEFTSRLIAQLEAGQRAIQAVVGQSIKVVRGTEAAYQIGLDEAEATLRKIYTKDMDTVQDIRRISAEDSLDGVAYVEGLVGRPDGGGFKTPVQALSYGTRVLGLKDQFIIERSGMEHFIRIRRNVDETSDAFRAALMSNDNKSILSKIPAILQWLRSPEDKFSVFMRGNRSTAISGSQRVQALMRDLAGPIEKLSGTEKGRLERMMEINRDTMDPLDASSRGAFYNSIAEFETAYKKEFFAIPSERETNAYFAAVQINDVDYVFRNLGIYRDKARLGYENISIEGITVKPGTERMQTFEGKVLKDIPFDDGHEAGILIYGGPGDSEHRMKSVFGLEERARLNKRIKEEGWKVVQVMNPADRSFKAVTDKSVNFIVTKHIGQTPLSYQQIPYKPGFHVKYKDEWFSKQGQFEVLADGSKRRLGDHSIMSHTSEAKSKKVTENLEIARILYNSGDDEALKLHLEKNLPEEWSLDTYKNKYKDKINPKTGEVIQKAIFNKDVPFVSVRTGQSVSDGGIIHKDGKGFHELFPDLEDPLSSPYNDFAKVNKQFAGQRDPTLDALSEGSEANPVYRLDKSNLVRPMDVLQNSMATIIRNRYFEDLQIVSAESYIQEFGDILLDQNGKAFNREALRRNPILALHEAQFDRKADPLRVSQARQIRAHTLDLLGTPSLTSQHIMAYTDKLKDMAYRSFGEKGVKMIPERLIHTISDPFHYARSLAFHSKLGLFNPVQLFTQGQTLAVTTMIAPRYATRSLGGSAMMRRLSMTSSDAIIDHMATLQSKIPGFGMKKEEFKDSYFWLKETGFDLVGQDHAWRGDIFDEKLFRSKGKSFLDKGTMFFSGTERFTRINAWNTAYMEYAEKNLLKGGRIGPKDAQKILLRAKELNVNMSRESNAVWQQGFGSSFSQFFGYQARLMDLMIGKRLGTREKMQLLVGMGALYGVSGPANMINPFYNVYDDIREAAIARGIDPNAGLMGYVMNGIPAMIYAQAFGDQPNFGERLGPSGFPIFDNITKAIEDETLPTWLALLEQAGGAGASITTQIIHDTVPFTGELLDLVQGKTTANITMEAGANVLKNISSVNQFSKAYMALKTGQWISKSGAVLQDGVDPAQAMFYAVTGTQSQDIPDAFFQNNIANEFKGKKPQDALGDIQKEARTMMKKYLVARDAGDQASADVWNQRLSILFNGTGMTPNQQIKILTQSLQGDTMVEAILKKFLKNGPPEQLKARMETFGNKGTQQ